MCFRSRSVTQYDPLRAAFELTRFAAFALTSNMAIAAWKVHLVNGFFAGHV